MATAGGTGGATHGLDVDDGQMETEMCVTLGVASCPSLPLHGMVAWQAWQGVYQQCPVQSGVRAGLLSPAGRNEFRMHVTARIGLSSTTLAQNTKFILLLQKV